MYDLRFSKEAGKYLQKTDRPTRERIKRSLLELAENPYDTAHLDVKKLAGYEDAYRIRIGKWNVNTKLDNFFKVFVLVFYGLK
ncbi:MAG: type II toxin-antitoxin system RelE/ParE family toxin [Ectobacillus sp.]